MRLTRVLFGWARGSIRLGARRRGTHIRCRALLLLLWVWVPIGVQVSSLVHVLKLGFFCLVGLWFAGMRGLSSTRLDPTIHPRASRTRWPVTMRRLLLGVTSTRIRSPSTGAQRTSRGSRTASSASGRFTRKAPCWVNLVWRTDKNAVVERSRVVSPVRWGIWCQIVIVGAR